MDTQWISIAPRCSYHLPADGPRRGEDGRVASSTAKSPSSQESSGGAGEKRWKVRRVTTVVHDKSLGHFTSIKTKKNIKGISTGHFRMVLYRKKSHLHHIGYWGWWLNHHEAGWGQDCWQNCLVILWTYQRWTSVDSIGRIIWHTKSHRIKFRCLWTKLRPLSGEESMTNDAHVTYCAILCPQ